MGYWLPLREFNQKIEGYGINLGDMLNAVVFSRSGYTSDATPPTLHRLLQEHLKEKVLFLLDGYDELKADSPYRAVIDDLLSNHNPAHVIVTSRPFHITYRTFDRTLEVVGFTEENVTSYVQTYFDNNSEIVESLMPWLEKNPMVMNLAHIPMLLGLICNLWDNPQQAKELQLQQSLTMTSLYSMLVAKLWRRYEDKYAPKAINSEERGKFNKWRNFIRNFLERLAYEMLYRDDMLIDVNTLCQMGYEVFKKDWDLERLSDFEPYFTSILEPGFLYKQGPGFINRETYYFLHKTLQEYFAACFIMDCIQTNQAVPSVKKDNIITTLTIDRFIAYYKYTDRQ